MLPSVVERDIEDGVRSFIEREFPVATPGFRSGINFDQSMVDDFLAKRENFIKGPWLEIRRPFRNTDEDMTEVLPSLSGRCGIGTEFKPYQHQLVAFKRLRMPGGQSTIVATGTGSGKTECFLYPVLDYVIKSHEAGVVKGIKALIIYPMNALATDQSKRLVKLCSKINSKTGLNLSVGLFTGAPGEQSKVMDAERSLCITDRQTLRDYPPDILITNYKMLDYLLLREEDQALWKNTNKDVLRYLIVDELHTFDGAQGTDLACLIRRLRDRLGLDDSLICVGTSATLGGDSGLEDLQNYATEVFGADFRNEDAVVREDRLSSSEYFAQFGEVQSRGTWPSRDAVESILAVSRDASVYKYISTVLRAWFPQEMLILNENEVSWRRIAIQLSELLPHLDAFKRLMGSNETLFNVYELAKEWSARVRALKGFSQEDVVLLIRSLAALVSMARLPLPTDKQKTMPFLNVRVQMWMRELTNMVSTVERSPRLMPAANYDPKDCMALPVVTCRNCNATAWGAIIAQSKIKLNLQEFYQAWFSRKANTKLIYPIAKIDYQQTVKNYPREIFVVCQRKKAVQWIDGQKSIDELYAEECPICGQKHEFIVARIPDMVSVNSTDDGISNLRSQTCPYCESPFTLRVVGARSSTLSAAALSHLRSSTSNDDPKLIAFSDSVQDAAQRSGFLQARSYLFAVRQALAGYLRSDSDIQQNLEDLLWRAPAFWKARLGNLDELEQSEDPFIQKKADLIAQARFVSTFVPTDMMWRFPWLNFDKWAMGESKPEEGTERIITGRSLKEKRLAFFDYLFRSGDTEKTHKAWNKFAEDIEGRLRWEMFVEMTIRSHAGRTIEHSYIGALAPSASRVTRAIEYFKKLAADRVGGLRYVSDQQIEHFIEGFLMHQKSRGAFDLSHVPGLGDYAEFVKTANSYVCFNMSNVLPTYGKRFRPPSPLIMRKVPYSKNRDLNNLFDHVMPSANSDNWYSAWITSCFANAQLEILPAMEEVFTCLFKALVEAGLMKVIYMTTQDQTPVYLLDPKAWTVSRDLSRVVCNRCGRWHIVPHEKKELWSSMPCLSQACPGDQHMVCAAEEAKELYLGQPCRTISREHTANVESEERGRIEKSFSEGKEPWDVNLLSATPTLEMGIDIGDLSSVLLSSMPPQQSNYIQRIGRAGRRDGNALAMTVCGNNPHAQYFWSDPTKMLGGDVEAPGVYLHAMAVIERQLMAYTITRWMSEVDGASLPNKIGPLLKSFAKTTYKPESFPQGYLDFVSNRAEALLSDFVLVFKDPASGGTLFTVEERERLKAFLLGDIQHGTTPLKDRLLDKLRSLTDAKMTAELKVRNLGKAMIARRKDAADEARDADIAEITATIESLNRLIAEEYVNKDTLQILTDEGLLPNYAFPEEGIKVEGVVLKVRSRNTNEANLTAEERAKQGTYKRFQFQRAASSGLLEVAPNNTFYVNDFALHIDQVDLGDGKIEKWHFCPACQYSEQDLLNNSSCCPRCGDPRWAAGEQLRSVLKMKTVYAWADIKRDRISDDREERQVNFQNRRLLIDIPVSAIRNSFVSSVGGEGFGFEFLSSVTIRDFNFGASKADNLNTELSISGEKIEAPGFTVCDCCGRLRSEDDTKPGLREEHDYTCNYWRHPEKARWIEGLVLYREFNSEALRIRVPGGMLARSNSPEIITASLSAALRLGLRKYFKGSVDHLRIVEMSQPREGKPPQHYIIVHDTVPGGTGYLKELMSDSANLMHVFELARDGMSGCACSQNPEADGCYQCLYQHSNASRRAFISKQCAIDVVSLILDQKQNLASGQLDEDDAALGDSELEATFIRALRNNTNLVTECKECHSGGNRVYFLIKMRSGRLWRMDLQVDYAGSRPCRPDFVFKPAHEQDVTNDLTMAVFTDGWQFHAPIVEDDCAKRQSLLNLGIHVWTLGWNDIPKEFEEAQEAPILPYRLSASHKLINVYDAQVKRYLEKVHNTEFPTGGQILERWVDIKNNFDRLLEWLNNPKEAESSCIGISALMALTTLIGEDGRRRQAVRACADLEAVLVGSRPQKQLVAQSADTGCWQSLWTATPPYQSALFVDASLCGLKKDEAASCPVAQDLRQFWSMANIVQFNENPLLLPYVPYGTDHVLLEQNPWYDALHNAPQEADLPLQGSAVEGEPEDENWDDLIDLLPVEMAELVNALAATGVLKPEAGIDWLNPATQEIEETFDLYWKDQGVAVIYGEQSIRKAGDITIYPADSDASVIAEAVRQA